MSYSLNEKIKELTPYTPVSGNYPIRLDANESFFTPPPEILEEFKQAVAEVSFNRYPDPYARTLCKKFAEFYGINPKCVTAGNGSDELISVLFSAFVQKGDRILVTAPDFSMYKFYAHLAECHPIVYAKNEDFSINFESLAATANRDNAKMIILSNPCNPTSVGFDMDQIRRLLISTDTLVVLDEAYMDFYDQSMLAKADRYPNLIVLRTCSKAIGMAALRLGFAVANETLTHAIQSVKSPYNVNALSQAVGSVLLGHPEFLRGAIEKIKQSRDDLYHMMVRLQNEYVGRIRVIKPDTNFVMVWMENAGSIYNSLLDDGIVVRNIGEFLRITAGTPEENEAVVKALSGYLSGGGF